MAFINPFFIEFDGTPVVNRTTARVRVHTPPDAPNTSVPYGAVRSAYHKFCLQRLAAGHGGHFVWATRLADGTRLRFSSVQALDIIDIWLSGSAFVPLYSGLAYRPQADPIPNYFPPESIPPSYTYIKPIPPEGYGTKLDITYPLTYVGPFRSPNRTVQKVDGEYIDAKIGIMERPGFYWIREYLDEESEKLYDHDEVYSSGNIVYFDNAPVAYLPDSYGFVVMGRFIFSVDWGGESGISAVQMKLNTPGARISLKEAGPDGVVPPDNLPTPELVLGYDFSEWDSLSVCPSPDGTKIAAFDGRGNVAEWRIWIEDDIPNAQLLHEDTHELATGTIHVNSNKGQLGSFPIPHTGVADSLESLFSPPGETFRIGTTEYTTPDIVTSTDHVSRTDTVSGELTDSFVSGCYYTIDNEREDITFSRAFSQSFGVLGRQGAYVKTQPGPTPTRKNSTPLEGINGRGLSPIAMMWRARSWTTYNGRYSGVAIAKTQLVESTDPLVISDVRKLTWGDGEELEVFNHTTNWSFSQWQNTVWSDLEEGQDRLGRYLVAEGECEATYSSSCIYRDIVYFDPTRDIFVWIEREEAGTLLETSFPMNDLQADPFAPAAFGDTAAFDSSSMTPIVYENLLGELEDLPWASGPSVVVGQGTTASFTTLMTRKVTVVAKIRGEEHRKIVEEESNEVSPDSYIPNTSFSWYLRSFTTHMPRAFLDGGTVMLEPISVDISEIGIRPYLRTYPGSGSTQAFRFKKAPEPGQPPVLELIGEVLGQQFTEEGFVDWLTSVGFPEEDGFTRHATCFRVGMRIGGGMIKTQK